MLASSTTQTTGYQKKVLIASMLGYAMDGLDLLLVSFVMIPLIHAFHLTPQAAGFIASITLWGAVFGGLLFGYLADRYGRVVVLSYSILFFAVFTGLSAFAPNVLVLDIVRFLAGMGLGGEFGIGMTLVTEVFSAKSRAKATAGVGVGFQLGVLLAILLNSLVQPTFGWRGVFLVGVLPALFAAYLRFGLSEPPRAVRKHVTWRQSLSPLIAPKRLPITIGLFILTSVQNFGYYGVMIWLPTLLAKVHHLGVVEAGNWATVTVLGMIIGILVFGYLADRMGRKPTFLLFQIGSAVMIPMYGSFNSLAAMVFGGALLGFFINGMLGGYGVVMGEIYPREARATAQNVIFNLGRFVGGFGPVVVGYWFTMYHVSGALTALAGTYVIAALATLFLIPETKGREVN